MASIFTQIINRHIPAHIVAENEDFIAFLDASPLIPGHTLVVAKLEIDRFFDMPDSLLIKVFPFAKQVAQGLEKAIPCLRVGMSIVGLEVPHAHLHLFPLQGPYDIDFKRKPLAYTYAQLAETAQHIRTALYTIC